MIRGIIPTLIIHGTGLSVHGTVAGMPDGTEAGAGHHGLGAGAAAGMIRGIMAVEALGGTAGLITDIITVTEGLRAVARHVTRQAATLHLREGILPTEVHLQGVLRAGMTQHAHQPAETAHVRL